MLTDYRIHVNDKFTVVACEQVTTGFVILGTVHNKYKRTC